MKIKRFILLAILLIITLVIPFIQSDIASADPSWLEGWKYRKAITIDGSVAGNQTDYQMNLLVAADIDSIPSVNVNSTTDAWGANGAPYQRQTFYAKSRYWYFYADGSGNGVFSSSIDGETWSAATTFKATIIDGAYQISVVVDDDGEYCHIVYYENKANKPLYYGRGQLDEDGTISWDTEREARAAVPNYRYADPQIILDSDGYPVVGYGLYHSTNLNDGKVYAAKSSTKDGTWSEEFNQQINSTIWAGGDPVCWPSLVRLSSGKIYATGTANGYVVEGRLYNGSSWGDVEDLTETNTGSATTCLTADSSDNVYLTFTGGGNWLVKRTYSTGIWGSAESIENVSDGQITSAMYGDEVYIFGERHVDSDYVLCYIKRSADGSYSTTRVLEIFSPQYVVASNCGGISDTVYNGCFIHNTNLGTGSPYSPTITFIPLYNCEGHAQSDFADIRFTSDDGETLLPYWIEDKSDDEYAKIWIKIDDIPESPDSGSIYIYYENSGASTTSNIKNTAIIGDDFEDDSFDTDLWQNVAGCTESGSTLKITQLSDVRGELRSVDTYAVGYRAVAKFKSSLAAGSIGAAINGFDDYSDRIHFFSYSTSWRFNTEDEGSYSYHEFGTYDSLYHDIEYKLYTGHAILYFDGEIIVDKTADIPDEEMKLWSFSTSTNDEYIEIDYWFVGKYVTPEPTWGEIGAEEGRVLWGIYVDGVLKDSTPFPSGGGYIIDEDFTTYTEVDPGSDITVTAPRITFTNLYASQDFYVIKDMGEDYFDGNFEHDFTIYVDSQDDESYYFAWGLSNAENTLPDIDTAEGDYLGVSVGGEVPTDLAFEMYECNDGDLTSWYGAPYGLEIEEDTLYYCTVIRNEGDGTYGTLYLYVYTDESRETLLDDLYVTLTEKQDFRYIYGISDGYTSGVDYATGYIEDFCLHLPSGGGYIVDNDSDWDFCQNDSVMYLEYQEITVDGEQRQYIEWEYDAVFHDTSGYNNDATPSFRTESSDADVSAEFINFRAVSEATAPAYAVDAAPEFITGNITADSSFSSGGVTPGTRPGDSLVDTAATAAGVPNIWLWGILGMVTIALSGLLISYMERKHGSGGGTLLLRFGVQIAILGILTTFGIFDFWMVVIYAIIAIAIMMASKQHDFNMSLSQLNLIGFLAMTWVGLTMINQIQEGYLITSAETAHLNQLMFTQEFTLLDTFHLPIMNFEFFSVGIPSLLQWDYGFFGGNAQIIQYMLYSLTAVVSMIVLLIIVGTVTSFFARST